MNKIVVVEDKLIESGNYDIDFKSISYLTINGNVTLNNIGEYEDINIVLKKDSNLILNKFDNITKNIKIEINMNESSNLEFNYLIINEGINKVVINIKLNGSKNIAKIKVRALNKTKNSKLDIICNGIINKNTIENELLEDLKGLNDLGTIKISPNMEVYTSEVSANHLVTIGSFSKEEIFYLLTKGLSKQKAKEILKLGFMMQIYNKEFKEKIMEVIKYE